MSGGKNLLWDTCVFIRYLTGFPAENGADIATFLKEAAAGEVVIHYSTVSLAEISPKHLKKKGYGTIFEFLSDFEGAFSPVDSSPDIMARAAMLRDYSYPHPNGSSGGKPRVIGTADAIILSSCLYARDVLGIGDLEFHTFDDGKARSWEGKCVPLLSFQDWGQAHAADPLVKGVIDLPRSKPIHPQPDLLLGTPPSDEAETELAE